MNDVTPKYEMFILRCKDSGSLNFPIIARDVGLDWTRDVKPLLVQDADFRVLFVSYLEDLKWSYVDSIRIKATHDSVKKREGSTHAYTKETIRYLDALISALGRLNTKSSQFVADLSELEEHSAEDDDSLGWTGTPSQ